MVCRCKTGVTYQQSPTVLELFAVHIVLFAVASGMAAPIDCFQQVNESDGLGLEWSLVTGTQTLLFYSQIMVSHTFAFCIRAWVVTFSLYVIIILYTPVGKHFRTSDSNC